MNRRVLGVLALAVIFSLAGCNAVFGPPATDEEALAANATYDWDTSANASLSLEKSNYTAIYRVENRSTFSVYHTGVFGGGQSIDVSALRFRYANGTVVEPENGTLTAERGGGETTITLPANVSGQVAFEAPRQGKAFTIQTHVDGDYAVTLPQGARVGVPILADVRPGGFSTPVEDGRVTVHWEDVDQGPLQVRWYLERDLLIFALLVAIGLLLGAGGTVYYYRQIKRLKARREEVGLDVDHDDDDPRDKGPPPGMR